MSALAHILVQKGIRVSGSDAAASSITEKLKESGVRVEIVHRAANAPQEGAVVYSSAVTSENPEMQCALAKQLPILHRSDVLASLLNEQKALLVAGVHGKTTTSALLTHLFVDAALEPSFAIGGIVRNLGTNGGFGKGEYFIAEADESDGSFLKYNGYGAILTNIDHEHLDYWENGDRLLQAFKEFEAKIVSSDHLFWCCDDQQLCSLNLRGVSYGFDKKAALRIANYQQAGWSVVFDFTFEGKLYENVEVPLIGGHNVLNSAAVFGLGLRCQISEAIIRKSLLRFQGVNRRSDKKGEAAQIVVYDDYAHHPTEIFATLRAFKMAAMGKRLVVVFQPHRYTRVRDCMETFPAVFDNADELIVTDIYSAGESPIASTTAALVKKIGQRCGSPVQYIPKEQLVEFLKKFLCENDILITMGAGDVTKVGPDLLAKLKAL